MKRLLFRLSVLPRSAPPRSVISVFPTAPENHLPKRPGDGQRIPIFVRRPSGGGQPAAYRAAPTLFMGNGKGGGSRVSWSDLRHLCDSCGHPELPRRVADQALEVVGELALVREAGVRGDLRQG